MENKEKVYVIFSDSDEFCHDIEVYADKAKAQERLSELRNEFLDTGCFYEKDGRLDDRISVYTDSDNFEINYHRTGEKEIYETLYWAEIYEKEVM